ncbi:NAD(P)H-binding protein [Acrocarpospora catenulata]|uniref:NAD(P)H-binding protein n=1 Tax=Acrocarpospora catenulata TaxID=2836182 RepID=UPI001BDA6728|nr:NAD(P)H-binding protein [Acrocarpospora catenulata]
MRIVQLTPGLHVTEELDPGVEFNVRPWMSAAALRQAAAAGAHVLDTIDGPSARHSDAGALAEGADVVVIAPQSTPAPGDESRIRLLATSLVASLAARAPSAHTVLVSHFLVGHGRAHPNAKAGTWGLHEFERALRSTSLSWTIVRPTWLSLEPDTRAYSVHASQSPLVDGLVSAHGLAATIIAAARERTAAQGTTFGIYATPPEAGGVSLPRFAELRKDREFLRERVLT